MAPKAPHKKMKAVLRGVRLDDELDAELLKAAEELPSLSLGALMREAIRQGLPIIRKNPAKALTRSA